MSDEVRGRFGVVSPEAVAYLRAIFEAYARTPDDGWAEPRLSEVLQTECDRYGVKPNEIVLAGVRPRAE
jgi:hypothetical protein